MKRVAENVALQSILYVIAGNQEIKVFDYENEYDLMNDPDFTKGKCVYDGLAYRTVYEYSNMLRSRCRGLSASDGVIYFQIYTKYEEY